MRSRTSRIGAVVVLGLTLVWQLDSSLTLAQSATPEAAVVAPIASEVLGRAVPVTVENPELALGRVTVMPGAVLPIHFHPGTQIGVIVQGELTYKVFSGEIKRYRVDDPANVPAMIRPGETVIAHPGDALIESPDSIHQGRNNGREPLVVCLSTLFPAGAPRVAVIEATPVP